MGLIDRLFGKARAVEKHKLDEPKQVHKCGRCGYSWRDEEGYLNHQCNARGLKTPRQR